METTPNLTPELQDKPQGVLPNATQPIAAASGIAAGLLAAYLMYKFENIPTQRLNQLAKFNKNPVNTLNRNPLGNFMAKTSTIGDGFQGPGEINPLDDVLPETYGPKNIAASALSGGVAGLAALLAPILALSIYNSSKTGLTKTMEALRGVPKVAAADDIFSSMESLPQSIPTPSQEELKSKVTEPFMGSLSGMYGMAMVPIALALLGTKIPSVVRTYKEEGAAQAALRAPTDWLKYLHHVFKGDFKRIPKNDLAVHGLEKSVEHSSDTLKTPIF